jgi:hypothetical protein
MLAFYQRKFLGAFAKLRKATISFVMSVRPSAGMKKFGFELKNFHNILCFSIFSQSVEKIQVLFKSDNNKRVLYVKTMAAYDNILLNSS